MKNTNLILLTFIVALLSFGMIDSATTKEKTNEPMTWEQMLEEERIKKEIEELRIKQYHEDELQRFLHDIGFRESGNRYDITNNWGYMGRYQFGKATLKGLGYNVTKKEFLNNPQLQDSAMIDLLNHNKEKLQSYIDIYDGKTINGMEITESGILAAAHLGGQGSVKRYFRNGKVFRDGNGTKITSYMKQFSGYDIKLN
jgi:arsenate reductase-like glutaredoxin family protein